MTFFWLIKGSTTISQRLPLAHCSTRLLTKFLYFFLLSALEGSY